MSRTAVLLLACVAGFVAVTSAYPTRWDPCSPPKTGQGDHFAADGGSKPLADKGIRLVLTYKGKAKTKYCPGATYRVKITWPTRRHAFITTRFGRLSPSDGCGGKRYRFTEDEVTKSWTATLRIPCSARVANRVQVVTAESSTSPYKQNAITIRRDSAAACRAISRC